MLTIFDKSAEQYISYTARSIPRSTKKSYQNRIPSEPIFLINSTPKTHPAPFRPPTKPTGVLKPSCIINHLHMRVREAFSQIPKIPLAKQTTLSYIYYSGVTWQKNDTHTMYNSGAYRSEFESRLHTYKCMYDEPRKKLLSCDARICLAGTRVV
jgi:hypothetical protein